LHNVRSAYGKGNTSYGSNGQTAAGHASFQRSQSPSVMQSVDRHALLLKRGGGMSQHLRSGLVTTAHKKECGYFREITRENYLMASKLKDVQTRSNKYLHRDNRN
jgi:hypothetical protein